MQGQLIIEIQTDQLSKMHEVSIVAASDDNLICATKCTMLWLPNEGSKSTSKKLYLEQGDAQIAKVSVFKATNGFTEIDVSSAIPGNEPITARCNSNLANVDGRIVIDIVYEIS